MDAVVFWRVAFADRGHVSLVAIKSRQLARWQTEALGQLLLLINCFIRNSLSSISLLNTVSK